MNFVRSKELREPKMTKEELTRYNVGEDLDMIMNLDPRGYGICRILYAGSRKFTGSPVAMNAAQKLCRTVKAGDVVFIVTGFVLLPHKMPETDGFVSSMLLARALVLALDAKPVIVCPAESEAAVEKCSNVVGLHFYEDLKTVKKLPLSLGCVVFEKDRKKAAAQAKEILDSVKPSAVISIEAPGANAKGEYHNATGINVTALQAKSDILFSEIRKKGILNIAIGDLGNESGMGSIAAHIRKYVPYTAAGECKCKCRGGILSAVQADNIITSTTSDWGCYAMIAAMAYLRKDPDICPTGDMEKEVMRVGSRAGMIDMTGSLIPGIDGFNARLNGSIIDMMYQCVGYALKYKGGDHWFSGVIGKKYFAKVGV